MSGKCAMAVSMGQLLPVYFSSSRVYNEAFSARHSLICKKQARMGESVMLTSRVARVACCPGTQLRCTNNHHVVTQKGIAAFGRATSAQASRKNPLCGATLTAGPTAASAPMQTAQDVKGDELGRRVVAAALHLQEHGWAVVDDVLPRCISLPRNIESETSGKLPCKKLPSKCCVCVGTSCPLEHATAKLFFTCIFLGGGALAALVKQSFMKACAVSRQQEEGQVSVLKAYGKQKD